MDTKEFEDLLLGNHNLILTGAPGTGKTYLAKEIARKIVGIQDEEQDKELMSRIGFVQFHPSYDYTDFVEGLRPTMKEDDSSIGFERRDGVFKEFCKAAINSITEIEDNDGIIDGEGDDTYNIDSTVDDINQETFVDNTPTYTIDYVKKCLNILAEKHILVKADKNHDFDFYVNKDKECFCIACVKSSSTNISDSDLSEITTALNNDTTPYETARVYGNGRGLSINELTGKIKEITLVQMKGPENNGIKTKSVKGKEHLEPNNNFVFIIDEINRGDLSKIFGELFFAIDPGYRGEKGRVKTQYQNLIAKGEGDPFEDGFFVPENVYIIGTMNDIDRSVENMDFAMRRRFAWKEISTEYSQSMLDDENAWTSKTPDKKTIDEIKQKMNNLNSCIIDNGGEYSNSDRIGLSKAYQIGASYFLKYDLYQDFEKLWDYHIKGILYEYLRGAPNIDAKMERLEKAYNPKANESD